MSPLTYLVAIVQHTPVWVWCLLAGLIALGLMQARDHVLNRPRVLVQPVALGLFSLWGATHAFGLHAVVLLCWAAGLGLGLALNRVLILPRRVQALAEGRFAIGGSWAPMVLLVSIFVVRYAVAVMLAITPSWAADPGFSAAACLVYGLPAGLLVARAARVLGHAQVLRPLAGAGA